MISYHFSDVVRQRQRIQIDGIDPADPLSGLLKSGTKPVEDDKIGKTF
jgi:hypothetical protein